MVDISANQYKRHMRKIILQLALTIGLILILAPQVHADCVYISGSSGAQFCTITSDEAQQNSGNINFETVTLPGQNGDYKVVTYNGTFAGVVSSETTNAATGVTTYNYSCFAGYYGDTTGCHAIGTTTSDARPGIGANVPIVERSCPAGTHPDWNQIVSCQCLGFGTLGGNKVKNGGKCCHPCDEPPCKQQSVITAACCDVYQPVSTVTNDPNGEWVTISWAAGTGVTAYRLMLDANKDLVTANCSGATPCKVKEDSLSPSTLSYTVHGLTPGTVYYYKMSSVNSDYKNGVGCRDDTGVRGLLSSCKFDSDPIQVIPNKAIALHQNIEKPLYEYHGIRVYYSSGNTSAFTIKKDTSPDTKYPYYASIVAKASGTGILTGSARFGASNLVEICKATPTVNVGNAPVVNQKWWQVKDSDIASNGDITSVVPSGKVFDIAGDGVNQYPGVPAYTESTNLTATNVSATGWLAQSSTTNPRSYEYDFFANQIPQTVTVKDISGSSSIDSAVLTSGTPSDGYLWYKYAGTGDATIDSASGTIDIGTNKVILFIEAKNLTINSRINLTKGQGFFMIIANGGITINSGIGGSGTADLEGIYLASGKILTNTTGTTDVPLWVRGAMASYGGLSLDRNLADNANPAEFFEYAPDQIMLFPKALSTRKINWKEVAP